MTYPGRTLTAFFRLTKIRPSEQNKVTNSFINAWLMKDNIFLAPNLKKRDLPMGGLGIYTAELVSLQNMRLGRTAHVHTSPAK